MFWSITSRERCCTHYMNMNSLFSQEWPCESSVLSPSVENVFLAYYTSPHKHCHFAVCSLSPWIIKKGWRSYLWLFAQNHFIRKSKTSIVLTSPGFLNVDIYFCVQCCYSLSCYIFAFSWKYTFNIRHTPVPLFKQHAALQWVMLLKWTRRCHCFAIRTHPNTKMWMTFILAA